jgi:anti-sigma factor RsiW
MRLAFWRKRAGEEIVCQQWVEMVTDYLEGTLPPALQQAADRHLADCPHCTEYLAQMRRTISVAHALGDHDVPPDVVDALTRAFTDYYSGGSRAT